MDYRPITGAMHRLELMRRIKLAWDPNLILNPGKVFNA